MAERTTISTIITIIIIVFVLVIAIFGILKLKSSDLLKELLPDFTKKDLKVKYNQEFKLERPDLIVYYVSGWDARLYFRYVIRESHRDGKKVEVAGWEWKKDKLFAKEDNFISANLDKDVFFEDFSDKNRDKNKKFIVELSKKSPEDGLKLIVDRVVKNDEGNFAQNVYLTVYFQINGKNVAEREYSAKDKKLLDLDGLIDTFNQISRGVLLKIEANK